MPQTSSHKALQRIQSPVSQLKTITAAAAIALAATLHAQDPKAIVSAAVESELRADHDDHSAYMYRDHDITPDHDTLFYDIETPQGILKKKLEDHGKPLAPEERRADDLRIHGLLADPAAQARQRKDSSHDDDQAEQMLKLLPEAFIWTIKSQTPQTVTLGFKPDPQFSPKNMEARVLSAMAGEIVVHRDGNRIQTIRGTLVDDVKIAYGMLGRLNKGGSFNVERREVVPHHWQIVESHVHILGKVLFFKTIGSEEDEVRSDFKPSPAETLQQAAAVIANVK